MQAVADETMMRNALGDEYDTLIKPPYTEYDTAHPLAELVVAALREVYDPEIPVNIFELGLIYKIVFIAKPENPQQTDIFVEMTLTSPACPVAQEMPLMVQSAILPLEGVADVEVDIVWDPTWTPDMMAETAKLQLNMFT